MKLKFFFALYVVLLIQTAQAQVIKITGSLCVNNELSFNYQTTQDIDAWLWDFGDGNTSNAQFPTHQYADSGYYTIVLNLTSNGSNYNVTETKYISENPTAGFIADSIHKDVRYATYARVFFNNTKSYSPISNYTWNFGDNSERYSTSNDTTLHKFFDSGTYTVWLKVTDSNGCIDSVSNPVTLYDRFLVPNVFTPNNDLINDEFIITSNGRTLFSIEIYSRWGNIVFKREGHEQIVWDGRMPDGNKVKPGTYYYVLSATEGNITYTPEKGFITVFY